MNPTTTKKTVPPMQSTPSSALEEPLAEVEALFPPSPELGEQLKHLHDAQVEIDRKRASELARLRELQDRD
jgi:hypothetical protein